MRKFIVCGNVMFGTGHPVENKTAVIEVDIDVNGYTGRVIAPQAFADKWPTITIAGSREHWAECKGPARLLTDKEWIELLATTKPL